MGVEWLIQRHAEGKTELELLVSYQFELDTNFHLRLQFVEWSPNLMKAVINHDLEMSWRL